MHGVLQNEERRIRGLGSDLGPGGPSVARHQLLEPGRVVHVHLLHQPHGRRIEVCALAEDRVAHRLVAVAAVQELHLERGVFADVDLPALSALPAARREKGEPGGGDSQGRASAAGPNTMWHHFTCGLSERGATPVGVVRTDPRCTEQRRGGKRRIIGPGERRLRPGQGPQRGRTRRRPHTGIAT